MGRFTVGVGDLMFWLAVAWRNREGATGDWGGSVLEGNFSLWPPVVFLRDVSLWAWVCEGWGDWTGLPLTG